MSKIITILIIIIIFTNLVNAEYATIEFDKYLKELKEKEILNDELIKNLNNLDNSQKQQIISEIKVDSEKFWNQWKSELKLEQKRELLRGLNLGQRNDFMEKYGSRYGVKFTNLGSINILFGEQNVIGSNKGYFQMDMIESYNKKNSNNKIISIEYKIDYKKVEGKSSLIFTRENGNIFELSTEGKSIKGFYFNPESGYIGKIGEDNNLDRNNPLTGHWNGKGSLKIFTNEKETKISFDFNRDSKNEAKDPANFAKFTNLKGDSYSVFRHPNGKDKEDTIYELKPGELTFDSNGKLTKISDMYKNKGTDSWGGFFGKDTSVLYNGEEFESAKGSKIMVDLEKGEIKSEVNRIEEGVVADSKNFIKKIQTEIEKLKEKVDNKIPGISEAYDKLTEAKEEYAEASKEIKNLVDRAKQGNPGSLEELGKANLRYSASLGRFSATRRIIETAIAKETGLEATNRLIEFISTDRLSTARNILTYASKGLGAAGDISQSLIGQIDSATSSLNIPIFSSLNPAPDSRMNIELSNSAAKNLKNIEMYGGSLEIADSKGNLVPIVKTATSYGYVLPSKLNDKNNYFDGINFNLYNKNYENGQEIKIFSDNGKLNAIGVGLQGLKTVDGQYVINAGGGVSYSYKILGGLLGGDEGYKGKYENILTADYKTSSFSIEKANAFQEQANKMYSKLYYEYESGGFTKQETDELVKIYQNNFIKYNHILNSEDIDLSVSSSRLNQILNSFSSSESSPDNSILRKIENDVYYNNKYLQKQLAERGISPFNIKPFVNQEITNINNFILSNPSQYLQFVKDSKSGIYQVKTAGNTYNLDSAAGPFISNILPVIAGHGRIDKNGNFDIDTTNSRFGKSIGINVYGGHYEGISQSISAQRNAVAIESGIQDTVKKILKEKLTNPASQGSKIYSPRY